MKIRIHWTLLLFGIVYFLSGFLLEILIFFLLVSLHEMAHLAVALSYGLQAEETVIYPFGGRARISSLVEEDPIKEFRIALAGPMLNIFLAIMGAALYQQPDLPIPESLIVFFIRANLMLALFNLLPGLPLDGGRILRSILVKKYSFKESTDYACQGGKLAGILLCILGIALGVFWQYYNISFFLVGIFIFIMAAREQKEAAYLYFRHLTRKRQLLQHQGAAVCETLIAFEHTTLEEITALFRPKKYHILHVIDTNWQRKAIIGEKEIINALLTRGGNERVGSLLSSD